MQVSFLGCCAGILEVGGDAEMAVLWQLHDVGAPPQAFIGVSLIQFNISTIFES
jgi:hypothetical protein